MSEQLPPPKSHGGGTSRRSHRKSRLGCANCKRRRIKCDERKPECTNCVKHSIPCDFTSAPQAPRSPSSASSGAHLSPQDVVMRDARTPIGPGGAPSPLADSTTTNGISSPATSTTQSSVVSNILDLELLHHYSTSTAFTISSVSGMQTFYRVNVPQIGFTFPFVLHGLMAFAALHLAHFRPERRAAYIDHAEHHWNVALRTATALLPTVNSTNAHALYIFAVISCFYTFAKGPKPRDFLVFSDQGIAEWLMLLRGIRAIMETDEDSIKQGPLRPIFIAALQKSERFNKFDLAKENEKFAELRQIVNEVAADGPHLRTYLAALDDVSRSYGAMFGEDGAGGAASSQVIFIWLYRVSDEFVACLQQREPMALIILAYSVVCLNEMSSHWWMNGWVYHLLSGVYYALDEGHRVWIRWPIEKLGWIPN